MHWAGLKIFLCVLFSVIPKVILRGMLYITSHIFYRQKKLSVEEVKWFANIHTTSIKATLWTQFCLLDHMLYLLTEDNFKTVQIHLKYVWYQTHCIKCSFRNIAELFTYIHSNNKPHI